MFNPAYYPYLRDKTHRLIFYGGAGSGKSYFIAQRSILKLLESDMCNLLCIRNVGETHKISTFALFKQVITKWHLSDYFKISGSVPSITCTLNGNCIIFKGLDDVEKLKSITAPKGEITDIWIEEASEIDEDSYNQLELRLRGGSSSKQIVISFNPVSVNHWLKKRFFDRKAPATAVIHTTYKDNLFLDDEYKNTLESYRTIDPYYYSVYCLGQWGVYGRTVFDAVSVSGQLAKGVQPVKVGYFVYEYDGMVIKNITWVDAPDGYIKIYKEPGKGVPYVIGGDTAGEGSDFFAAQVLDNTDGSQAAVLHHRFDEDLYARQMYCLGKYYNNALISVEVNFSSYPVRELDRMGYTSLYVRRTEDSYTHRLQKSYGFKTTSLTRPVAIAHLVELMRSSPHLVCDGETLEEMLTFVRNENGRPEAQNGSHDDLVMALAIAHYSREQQRDDILLPSSVAWSEDMYDDYYKADDETRKIILKKWGNPFEKQ